MSKLPLVLGRLAGCGIILAVSFLLPASTLAGSATPTEMGSGTAWLDCDNDGDLDLMYLTAFGDVLLYEYNSGQDRFTDISESALPEVTRGIDAAGMGVACGDFDNDGNVDVFLSMEGPNLLLMNNGDLTFRATTRASGISGEYLSASVGLIDYNNDGRLDIYIGNYAGGPNQLYRNDGVQNGLVKFTDVAPALGMDLAAGTGSDWTLGIAVADYNNDGYSDLYVANDYNGPNGVGLNPGDNILYQNNGDGTFTDVSVASGANDSGWAMGVTSGDYDGDGDMDIFLANFWEDSLLRNKGDGTFEDVTRDVGIITGAEDEWHYNGWGTSFIDFDNDGDMDIHVSNGYILNDQGQVVNEPNQLWENKGLGQNDHVKFENVAARAGVDDRGDARGAAYGDFNQDGLIDMMVINNGFLAGEGIIVSPQRMLYVNKGNGTFEDRAHLYGLRDKMQDPSPPGGYRDYTGNAWVQVKPVAPGSVPINQSGIGARIKVTVGDKVYVQDVGAASYASTNSPYLQFGLGNAQMIDEIMIMWPAYDDWGMAYSTMEDVPVNTVVSTLDMATPVRLLAFDAASEAGGARLDWTYADDGDLAHFSISRKDGADTRVLASALRTRDGRGTFLDTTAPVDRTVEYVLESTTRDGVRTALGTLSHRYRPTAGLALGQAYPNPFMSSARIPVLSPAGGVVSLDIYDAAGRRVRRLRETLPAGESILDWDGRGDNGRVVAAGVYFYRLAGDGAEHTRTLKIVRRP